MNLEDTPRTGLDHLAAALANPDVSASHLSVFTALGLNPTGFARDFAPALVGLGLNEHVTFEHADWLAQHPQSTAADLFLALQRTLPACVQTLRAITRHAKGPVHGAERPCLTATLRRVLIAAGYDLSDEQAKALTYQAADSLARCLDVPLAMPGPDPRRQQPVDEDALILDDDFYDWQTGEPKFPPACMATIEALLAVQANLAAGADVATRQVARQPIAA